MTTTVQAVYEEDDLLRLLSPLSLKKGDQVEVTVNTVTLADLERAAPDPKRAAEIMAEIAAMPMEPEPSEFIGTEHDLAAENLTEAQAQARLEIVEAITALAVPQGRQETASRDHDKFLYGAEGAR